MSSKLWRVALLMLMGIFFPCGLRAALNPAPPSTPVKLVFIHHSTGENWLNDENGELGVALMNNNFFVSDTNYGWGPPDVDAGYETIGDHTDIGFWYNWFSGPHRNIYLEALYGESGQNSWYSRLENDPGGENAIVMFKSCFPNSALQGSPDDPVPAIEDNPLKGDGSWSEYHTVANAKGIYAELLNYFRTRPDKLFIVVTAPPLSDPTYSSNARAFNQWLVNDWLKGYPYHNAAVFDFYNLMTTNGGDAETNDLDREEGNHHRLWNGVVQHQTDGDDDGNPNVSEYPSSPDDDHPSWAGNQKATGEFPTVLNVFYHCWQGTGDCPAQTRGHNRPVTRP